MYYNTKKYDKDDQQICRDCEKTMSDEDKKNSTTHCIACCKEQFEAELD